MGKAIETLSSVSLAHLHKFQLQKSVNKLKEIGSTSNLWLKLQFEN